MVAGEEDERGREKERWASSGAVEGVSRVKLKKTYDGEMADPAPTLKLSKMNYRVRSVTMEVFLESHNQWLAITGENILKNKDRLALFAIISAVLEDILMILDTKKMAKENWEILRQQNLGVDRVIQSCIQGMKRDFELLTMGK